MERKPEKLIQEKILDLDKSTANWNKDAVWKKLAINNAPKKNKRSIYYWLSAVAAVFILLFSLSYFDFGQRSEKVILSSEKNTTKPTAPKTIQTKQIASKQIDTLQKKRPVKVKQKVITQVEKVADSELAVNKPAISQVPAETDSITTLTPPKKSLKKPIQAIIGLMPSDDKMLVEQKNKVLITRFKIGNKLNTSVQANTNQYETLSKRIN